MSVTRDDKFIAAELSGQSLKNGIMLSAAILTHNGLAHFTQAIEGTSAQISVPEGTILWTLILYNKASEVFDSWTNRYFSNLSGMSTDDNFEASVRAALKQGEGFRGSNHRTSARCEVMSGDVAFHCCHRCYLTADYVEYSLTPNFCNKSKICCIGAVWILWPNSTNLWTSLLNHAVVSYGPI